MSELSKVIMSLCVGFGLSIPLTTHAGSCNYIQENMFAGPFKVCASPVSSNRCEEIATEGSNADAVYAEAECGQEDQVGHCNFDGYTIIYYSGDSESLEVGCGFQGGEWK